MTDPRRRLLLQCAALLPFAVALPSCARKNEDFLATDITGVDWGRDFHLADASGRMRTLADFRGRAVLLFFGYTHCPDVCPTTLSNMARAVDLLGEDGKRVQGLFVTLDPARDTPEVLTRYVPAFHADFIGLSGSEAQIERTAQDFKVFFARQAPDANGFYTVERPSPHCQAGFPSRTGAGDVGRARRTPMTIHRLAGAFAALWIPAVALAGGNPERGAQAFRACAGCHSLVAGDHRTGPSLAHVWGRRVGTAEGFHRYSDALRSSTVAWNEQTLDAWLRDPAAFIPGNAMAFRGLPDAAVRADLVSYLRAVSEGKAAAPKTPALPDLKAVDAGQRVSAIRHCGDTYRVTLGNGRSYPFWEFNLRFKTDSSAHGPRKGEPVIVGAGMGGDRAQVVFAAPEEISAFIRSECP